MVKLHKLYNEHKTCTLVIATEGCGNYDRLAVLCLNHNCIITVIE